jgi:uncharacterized protein
MPESARPRRVLAAGLVILSVAALTGCLPVAQPLEGTGVVIGPMPSAPDPVEELASGLTEEQYEEFLLDIDGGITVADRFWTDHWGDFFSGEYVPPGIHGDNGLYDGNDSTTDPGCGGAALGPQNAFYCIPEDFVAWDLGLMVNGYADGDAWVYLVIAHEWGHAIQARISSDLVASQSELQADCFAGAAIFGVDADSGGQVIEQGDLAEITTALSRLADTTAWTTEGDHGDPFQRIGAFDDGKEGGVLACLP